MIHITGPNHPDPPKESIVINTTSRSDNWSKGLSPFFAGPVDLYDNYKSFNVENAWQYSKCYAHLDHIDNDGNPTSAYFRWAEKGWTSLRANRYPMGKGVVPAFSYWNGEKLSYVEARKKIYIPIYYIAIKDTFAFKKLKKIYESKKNEDIYLWDFDAPRLPPGKIDYWKWWNDPNLKLGHAYVLGAMLEGVI